MKVLHVLYQSLPQISGSSIRSRDILMSQKEIGIDVCAITSPFRNLDENKKQFNGITYNFTSVSDKIGDSISDHRKTFFERLKRFFKVKTFSKHIKKHIKKEQPDILHAHAMFFCGLPTLFLAKKYKLPFVYEVRSLCVFCG